MSRTVIWLVAVGAVVIAGALGMAWRGKLSDQAVLGQAEKAVGQASKPAAVVAQPPAPPQQATAAAAAPTIAAVEPKASQAETLQPIGMPTFDVVRVAPDGRAVIAGRGAPGARIVLLDGGKEIARADADSRGEWVVIAQDPPLTVGQHELRVLQHIEGRAPVTSDQVVVALVPEPPAAAPRPDAKATAPTAVLAVPAVPKEETLVMISPPAGPAKLVQPPTVAGVPKSGDLGVSTIDYDDRGQVTIVGQATPGTVVRAYVDDKLLAEGAAGHDGAWKLIPSDLVAPGKHQLRIDRITADGRPVSRLELPFDRVLVASGTNDSRRLIVVRGDNLWNIARSHYGVGYHHTVIFGANKDQIRNPDLIYPGQVFTLPKVN